MPESIRNVDTSKILGSQTTTNRMGKIDIEDSDDENRAKDPFVDKVKKFEHRQFSGVVKTSKHNYSLDARKRQVKTNLVSQ